jgi:DNA repair exonuclease SbcCD ATPase subunit
MFTEEQVKQMREVMGEVVKPLDERLKGVEGRLTGIETTVRKMDERLKNVETVGSQTKSAVDALAEGQKDIRKHAVKELKNHERRITELEDQAHSHKN